MPNIKQCTLFYVLDISHNMFGNLLEAFKATTFANFVLKTFIPTVYLIQWFWSMNDYKSYTQ